MVGTTHLRTVMKDPEVFGVSKDYIESKYINRREKTGLEGRARDEILRRVLRNGWMRLRRHTNRYWSVQTGAVTEEKKGFIQMWAREILSGKGGYRETDPYMPVKIDGLEDGFRHESTVQELAGNR
jgi:hypothetical protein